MIDYFYGKRKIFLTAGAFVILLCYVSFLKAPFYFDDLYNISDNPYLISISSALKCKLGGFRPFAYLSFYLDKSLFGFNPALMRAENVLLHIVNYLLVYFFVKKILEFSALDEGKSAFIAFVSALLWGLNPVNSQSVAYVVQRMNVASSLFILAGLICFLDFLKTKKIKFVFFYIVCFIFSVGFKETGFLLLPLTLLLYLVFVDFKKGALIALAGGIVFLVLVFKVTYFQKLLPIEYFAGKPIPEKGFTFFERVFTEPKIVLDYIITFFLPFAKNIHLYFSTQLEKTFFSIRVLMPLMFLFLFAFWGVYLFLKNEKVSAFLIFAFFVSLFPESFIVPLDLAYLHRMYLPSVFLSAFVLFWVSEKVKVKTFEYMLLIIVLFFGINLLVRGMVYSSPEKFYLNELKFAPDNVKVYINASRFFLDNNIPSKARQFIENGEKKFPGNIELRINKALYYAKTGKTKEAIQILEKIGKNEKSKRKGDISFLLAVLYLQDKNFEKAEREINKLKKLNYRKDKLFRLEILLKKLKKNYSADTTVE